VTKLGRALDLGSGPVDRMKSAKSRTESSFINGSRATVPGERGPGDLGTGPDEDLMVPSDELGT